MKPAASLPCALSPRSRVILEQDPSCGVSSELEFHVGDEPIDTVPHCPRHGATTERVAVEQRDVAGLVNGVPTHVRESTHGGAALTHPR
jgi:hypothetical protein